MVVRETLERPTSPVSTEEIRARVALLPRVHFALLPTPLHELPRLAAELGIGRLFVKRDDLTGLAFGGNKTRNLEFRLAMDQGLRDAAAEQRALGRRPYVMNHAPAFALGSAVAYVLCTLEIVEQTAALGVEPTHLYMGSGNKGHAGLILGRSLLGRNFRTIAISQHYADDRVSGALKGARDAACALGWEVELTENDVESYDEYVETAYGLPSPSGLAAIELAARTEGLLLDPIYSGKAMAGLIDHAHRGLLGSESSVVFIHTGGLPALFAFKDEMLATLDRGRALPRRYWEKA